MVTSQYQGSQASSAGIMINGIMPGLDPNYTASVVQSATQELPGQIISVLSANPQIQQFARQGGNAAAGVNPQALFNLGVSLFDNKPQIGGQYGGVSSVSPQDFDIGNILNTIAQTAAQVAGQAIIGMLSSNPQIQQLQQLARQGGNTGGNAAGSVNPQSSFNLGASTPLGNVTIGLFDNKPQIGGQYAGAIAPQDFNIGNIVGAIAQGAIHALPGILIGMLSAHPQIQQIQQLAHQGGNIAGGVNPQSGNVSLQDVNLGNLFNLVAKSATQALPGLLNSLLSVHPQIQQAITQGLDLGTIARNLTNILAPQIPAIANLVIGQLLGNRNSV